MSEIYVALDIEATGMDPERDDILEIAAMKFRPDRVLDRWETLVRPRGPIPLAIASLTGLSARDLRQAPPIDAVLPRLRSFVGQHPIVGQSPQFDLQMLEAAGLRLQNPIYDTFQLATILLPDLPAYSLSSIASRLGVSVTQQHRAMADVETTVAVFLALRDMLLEYDAQTLQHLAEYLQLAEVPLAQLFRDVARELSLQGQGTLGAMLAERLHTALPAVQHAAEVVFLLDRDVPTRLEPRPNPPALDLARIRSFYAADGPFAHVLGHRYELRPQQVQMAEAVAHTLNQGGHLLVEAGTGTGKSLAYLLPAVLYAVSHGEIVVISTNTIALQDQLYKKDIPLLRRALEAASQRWPELAETANFRAAILKGRGNYLCLRRWFLRQREPARTPAEALLFAKVTAWLPQTATGDRAELHLSPEEQAAWSQLAEEEGSCVPRRCLFHRRRQCFLFRARAEAEAAHIVIVNHALLLSDVLTENHVLPPYHTLIIDESHNLEEEATDQFGAQLSAEVFRDFFNHTLMLDHLGRLTGALSDLALALSEVPTEQARQLSRELDERMQEMIPHLARPRELIDQCFQVLADFVDRYDTQPAGGYERQVRLTDAVRHDPAWRLVEEAAEALLVEMRTYQLLLSWINTRLRDIPETDLAKSEDVVTELDVLARRGDALRTAMDEIIHAPKPDRIYWISQQSNTGQLTLHMAPLDVAPLLQQHLFNRCDRVVLTSATLTVGGTFQYIQERLGLTDATTLRVPSPFDYQRSTLLCVPEDVPEPGAPGYQRAVNDLLIALFRATRGRGLVLFTSHSALQATYRAIKRPLERQGIVVLGQRIDGTPRQLIERLKARPGTVVLGTNSVWEGVDVPGEALSVLVIAKLPFAVPTDPVFAARSERMADPFGDYAVPQAVLRFKQGFGRLIRSATDCGVCVILDRRVLHRRYGQLFLASLPECTIEIAPGMQLVDAAARWLAEGIAPERVAEWEGDHGTRP